MDILFNFSTNWNNKLFTGCYTTLRMSDRYQIGDKGIITLKQQPQHIGEIIAKNPLKLDADRSSFLDVIAFLDTGYCWNDTVKIIMKMYSLQSIKGKIIYQYMVRQTKETIKEESLL